MKQGQGHHTFIAAAATTTIANQPAHYRGLLGPSGPKCRKSLETRGLRPRNPEKSPKSLGNSPESLRRVSKESFRTVPETFCRLFGVPGPEAPGDIFETFSAFRARRARETSVRGGLVRKTTTTKIALQVSEDAMGGVEKKRGVENLTNDTPPKKGFWTPPRTVRFPPPQVSMLCFSCTKIHDRADQKLFWRGPKIFGRAHSLVRFPPPIRFAPPHITAQK